ncbi:unnamed protein product [Blepharisma stoltei]|uniref:Uncharacterized protein n=1 Tax=Blepharisma stoltei TaxID=1481888 RepID=A0AAU9IK73_9CILI|nr:unnamed protein product [Blepharisma stoltei]
MKKSEKTRAHAIYIDLKILSTISPYNRIILIQYLQFKAPRLIFLNTIVKDDRNIRPISCKTEHQKSRS